MIVFAMIGMVMVAQPDGALIFLEHSNKIVEKVTDSSFTHVAIILCDQNEPYVYEAVRPAVRRVPLDAYLAKLKQRQSQKEQLRVLILSPQRPYTEQELVAMKMLAKAELGRPYSVRGYLRSDSVVGEHCSEFVSRILGKSGRYKVVRPNQVNPADLWQSVVKSHVGLDVRTLIQ